MSEVRVYQLEIVYPEGSHEKGWRPACWSDPRYLASLTRRERHDLARREFRWPRQRRFLSSSSAYARAGLLRWYGADVQVLASEPVTWRNYGDPDSLGEDAWMSGTTVAHWSPGHPLLADAMDKLITDETVAKLRGAPEEALW